MECDSAYMMFSMRVSVMRSEAQRTGNTYLGVTREMRNVSSDGPKQTRARPVSRRPGQADARAVAERDGSRTRTRQQRLGRVVSSAGQDGTIGRRRPVLDCPVARDRVREPVGSHSRKADR